MDLQFLISVGAQFQSLVVSLTNDFKEFVAIPLSISLPLLSFLVLILLLTMLCLAIGWDICPSYADCIKIHIAYDKNASEWCVCNLNCDDCSVSMYPCHASHCLLA